MLGSAPEELRRLELQHRLWLPTARAAWRRAALGPGQSVLDLGCGPGFTTLELARIVGVDGRALGLENDPAYLAHARILCEQAQLPQLRIQTHDLASDPLSLAGFDLIWCRWLVMFLPDPEPLLLQLQTTLRPGGQALFHEYVHWRSFGLHPNGEWMRRFGERTHESFRASGAEPDANRRLPSTLSARGFRIEELRPLGPVGGPRSWVARWLSAFVAVYGQRLQSLGLWSEADAEALAAELAAAREDPGSVWVGPTLLELRARLP